MVSLSLYVCTQIIKASFSSKSVLPLGIRVAPWREIAAINAPGIEPISQIRLFIQGWLLISSKRIKLTSV